MPEEKEILGVTFIDERWVRLRMPSCQQEIERAFEEIIHNIWGRAVWRPPVDILETAESWIVAMDLPGVDPGDVKVTAMDDSCLSIEGDRRELELKEGNIERTVVRERPAGRFSRLVHFRYPIDLAGIRQEIADGVLVLTVPKLKEGAIR